MRQHRWLAAVLVAFAFQLLVGCARPSDGPDPWEKTNRVFYSFNDNLDRAVLKPAADAYIKVVPKPIRTGVNNGFNNLGYFNVILNDFLQGNWEQGCRDSGRMAVNSTIGIAGIFDVATPLGMPEHETDFGITLGKWGVKPGPYIVMPLFGPSTLRDTASIPVSVATNPLTYVQMEWWVSVPLDALKIVDKRTEIERYIKLRNENALDGYIFTREAYLQHRENKVHDGAAPAEPGLYDDPDAPATVPATTAPATQPAQP